MNRWTLLDSHQFHWTEWKYQLIPSIPSIPSSQTFSAKVVWHIPPIASTGDSIEPWSQMSNQVQCRVTNLSSRDLQINRILVTLLSCYLVTLLYCYLVTLPYCYLVTLLYCYLVTLLSSYLVTLLSSYLITLLSRYLVISLPSYCVYFIKEAQHISHGIKLNTMQK